MSDQDVAKICLYAGSPEPRPNSKHNRAKSQYILPDSDVVKWNRSPNPISKSNEPKLGP